MNKTWMMRFLLMFALLVPLAACEQLTGGEDSKKETSKKEEGKDKDGDKKSDDKDKDAKKKADKDEDKKEKKDGDDAEKKDEKKEGEKAEKKDGEEADKKEGDDGRAVAQEGFKLSKPAREAVVGEWELSIKEDTIPKEQKAMVELATAAAKPTIKFTDKKATLSLLGQEDTVEYKVKSETGNQVVIEGQGKKKKREIRVIFTSEDDITTSEADSPIVFLGKRVKK